MSEFPVYDIQNYIEKEGHIYLQKKPYLEKLDLPTVEKVPEELLAIAENVSSISGTWNPVEIFTADNESIEREKQKVFDAYKKGEEYNPQLSYTYANSLDLAPAREKLLAQLHMVRQFEPSKVAPKKGLTKKAFKRLLFFKHDPKEDKAVRTARILKTALYFKIKDDLATCKLADGIKTNDETKIMDALQQKYPGTDESLYSLATTEFENLAINGDLSSEDNKPTGRGLLTASQTQWLLDKKLTPEETAEAFTWALSQYELLRTTSNKKGFYVKVSKEATGIDVRDKSTDGPTIFIPTVRSKPMSAYSLLKLIAHEIEGHARQSVNGEELFLLGGGRLKIDNEQLYEGLGLRYEYDIEKKLFGIDSPKPSPYYTLSTKMAEEGSSFYQIFKDQVERRARVHLKIPIDKTLPPLSTIDPKKFDEIKKQAWTGTYRVMRCHIDMSNKNKFAMSKDLGYLRGYQMDHQLKENSLGHINEEGVIASGALSLLAEFKLSPEKMPIPFKDVATQFWEEKLKPVMIKEQIAKAA